MPQTLLQIFQLRNFSHILKTGVLQNFKMYEFISAFKLIPCSTVYYFDKINDQLDILNRLLRQTCTIKQS